MAESEALQKQVEQVIAMFDLSKDGKITPEEFFNVIMALYE